MDLGSKTNRKRKLRTFSLGEKLYEFKYSKNNEALNLIDLCSNDYFGLSRDKDVIKASHRTSLTEGLGAGSSSFISGSRPIHKLLKVELSRWLNKEKILLFPSGFQANIAAVQALANRNTIIIADKLIHHSLLVGIKASGAKLIRFLHNNLEDLEKKIEKHSQNMNNILVIVESLYSMEGTIAPLEGITEICSKYSAKLIVDEAHSIGILGPMGKGLSNNFPSKISITSGTFGKAFGSGGAFLACDAKIGEDLIQTSGALRYTTALSPTLAAGALKSLEKIKNYPNWGFDLLNTAKKWKHEINKIKHINVIGDSQILSLIIGSEDQTILMQKYLEEKGFLAIGIRPPTVPVGYSRIRITIRKTLNDNILKKFISVLKNYK